MVTVFVWLPYGTGPRMYGHSAMFVDSITDGYISFYPGGQGKKRGKLIPKLFGTEASYSDSLEEDIETMEQSPDRTVEIRNLNERAIESYWLDIKTNNRKFSLLNKNCSAVVGEALHTGFNTSLLHSVDSFMKGFRWMAPENWRGLRKLVSADATFWTPRKVLEYAVALERVTR